MQKHKWKRIKNLGTMVIFSQIYYLDLRYNNINDWTPVLCFENVLSMPK